MPKRLESPETARSRVLTNRAYRFAAYESRYGLNGRRAGDHTNLPGHWQTLVVRWSLGR